MKTLIAYTVAFFMTLAAYGQNQVDSARVYFRIGTWQFDPQQNDNRQTMDEFVAKVKRAADTDNVERIVVRAYASPDGYNAPNVRLAQRRCHTIARYIAEHTGISPDRIEAAPGGIAWEELRNFVAANPDVPSQKNVLDILDNTPLWVFDANGRVVDGRKRQLMSLAEGVPYRWLLGNVFPQLRNAISIAIYHKAETTDEAQDSAAMDSIVADSIAVDSTAMSGQPLACDTMDMTAPADTIGTQPMGDNDHATSGNMHQPHDHRFALKTNFLYYGILMPNLEFEWMINDRWSAALNGDVAWWSNKPKHQYYRIAMITPEVRRWIKPRKPWHGMYAGLFAGAGWYDLENGKTGYQGEGVMTGLSFGYMWPIGRHLSLDAGIGAGYMYTQYKEYMPLDGHYLYMRTKSMHYFGPLKLKFSIAWHFNNIKKTKQTR